MTEVARVFSLLRLDTGRTAAEIGAMLGKSRESTSDILVRLRVSGRAAMYGGGRNARWLAVPGAKPPVDTRGKSKVSRKNLTYGPAAALEKLEAKRQAEQPVPDLSWANVLGVR